ncbi:hypothetical protein F5141DRAFT_1060670 [Pisolithus sp. B1]|nr:hypothetical protein F5141DRAFT_1060670 [Pisolithus sp. B1]
MFLIASPLDSPSDSHLPDESQDVSDDHDADEQQNVFQDQSLLSEEDEQEVESGMQSEHAEDPDQVEANHASDAENGPADSDLAQEDALDIQSKLQAHRWSRLPLAAIKKAQALGMCTAWEAQAIADEYGKMLASIMATAGLMTKATQVESVWNMHLAWTTNHCRQMKHYESHKDKEEFPDLWAEIHMFWSKSISGSNDMSSKAMVQTWCNVESIHIFGCVIYSGNDEAACQAQGIFAGSSLCMQLASERQMDIARLLDYLATIIKYKVLDWSVNVPLPTFPILSGISYDHILTLKPLKSTQDRNHLSPKAVADNIKITCGQKNAPWKTLLDLLYSHKHTIIDWLAEQMGKDYEMEAMVDDDDDYGDFIVLVPVSSFHLKPWTANLQAFLNVVPRGMHHEDTDEEQASTPTAIPSSPQVGMSQKPAA